MGLLKPKARSVVGLDIEPGFMAAAEFSRGNRPTLQRAATNSLAPGLFHEGEVTNVDGLAAQLRTFFRDNGLPKVVRLGVASQKIVVRVIELPDIEGKEELDAAVRFQAQEELPMPLEQAVLDHRVLERFHDGETTRMRVLMVAARREAIDHLLSAARKAGLDPQIIDLSAFAIVRALYVPPTAQALANGDGNGKGRHGAAENGDGQEAAQAPAAAHDFPAPVPIEPEPVEQTPATFAEPAPIEQPTEQSAEQPEAIEPSPALPGPPVVEAGADASASNESADPTAPDAPAERGDVTPDPVEIVPAPIDLTPDPGDATPDLPGGAPEPVEAVPEPADVAPEPAEAMPDPAAEPPAAEIPPPPPTFAAPAPLDDAPAEQPVDAPIELPLDPPAPEPIEPPVEALAAMPLPDPQPAEPQAEADATGLPEREPETQDVVLYCHVGGLTNLAIATGTTCVFNRVLQGGVESMAATLAERKALTLEHARQWVNHVALEKNIDSIEGEREIVAEAREVLLRGVNRIADEIRLSVEYYQGTVPNAGSIERIVLAGQAIALPGFPAALEREVGLMVEPRSLGALEVKPGALDNVDGAQLTVAAGLALDEVRS